MSDSLQPHGLQHARLPCPSPTPGAYSDSCPLSCDAIQPSHPLSFTLWKLANTNLAQFDALPTVVFARFKKVMEEIIMQMKLKNVLRLVMT